MANGARFLTRWPALLSAAIIGAASAARARSPDAQAYTGTLDSPPVPLTQAGAVYVQPYVYLGAPTGVFNARGDVHGAGRADFSSSSLVIVKYGITRRLSVYATPEFAYGWGSLGTTSGLRLYDLPVILQGYILDHRGAHWHNTVTLDIGMNFPTGAWDRLSRLQDGTGSGAYTFRYGLIDQTAFAFAGLPAFRTRLWTLDGQPVGRVAVHGASVYGAGPRFAGDVAPAPFGAAGGAIEIALGPHVVAGLDIIRDWSGGGTVTGRTTPGATATRVGTEAGNDWFFVPAMEYNWSATLGLVAGVGVTGQGHDTSRQVVGTAALAMTF